MKFMQKIMAVAVLIAACTFTASAQFNQFSEPRTMALTWPKTITATDSNSVIDIHGFEGVCVVDVIGTTNNATNGMTAQLFYSPDRTNWTALANYAVGTSNNIIYTNFYYGSATPLATNIFERPGTLTTPVASNGFLTAYTLPASFTNTGAQNLGLNNQNLVQFAFNAGDVQRYLQISYVVAGTTTNTVAALFIGRKQQE